MPASPEERHDRLPRRPTETDTSFSAMARQLVETLQARIPDSAVFVGYLDHDQERFWVVDASGDTSFGLTPGVSLDITESFCFNMAAGRSPQLCNDVANDPVYGQMAAQADLGIGSYVGVPLELADGSRIGSVCAIAHHAYAYRMATKELLARSARELSAALPTVEGALAGNLLRDTVLENVRTADTPPSLPLRSSPPGAGA